MRPLSSDLAQLPGPSAAQTRWIRHVPALDGVRGLAILLVMAHNFSLLDEPSGSAAKLVGLALNFGWVGVQLFFVLSGFLITNILLSTKSSSNYFRSFFGRRALRIFPLYYAALFWGLACVPLFTGQALEGSEHQFWLWTYLSNWAAPMGREVGLYPHMWSLAVEEQFYLIWPFVVYALSRKGLMRLCLWLTAAALLSRIGLRLLDVNPEASYMFTICRVDAIALGAIASLLYRDPRTASVVTAWSGSIRIALLLGTVLTIVATKGAPRVSFLTQSYGYTLFAALAAVFILDVAINNDRRKDWVRRSLCWAPLRKMGAYSYAAYVFHKPMHELVGLPLVERLTGGQPAGVVVALTYFVVLSACVFALALVSFHALEKHFLGFKRHFQASS